MRTHRLLLTPEPTPGGAPSPEPPPPAPEPTPTPEPTPEPESEPAPDEVTDVLLAQIIGDLKGKTDEVPPVEPAPEPTLEPAPTPAPPEPTPTPEPKKPKKITIVEPTAEPPAAPVVVPPTPAPAQAQADPDVEYVASLTDEQRDEIAEIEVAEKLYPDRYKGAKKKLIEFYRRFDKEAPGLEEDGAAFKSLMDVKPKLANLDYKKVQREIGKTEAVEVVRKEFAPELDDLKIGQAEIKARPKVAARLNQLEQDLNTMFVADEKSPMREVSKLFAEKGAEAAIAEFPLEASVANQELSRSRAMLAELTLFSNNATKFDQNNRAHMELFNFIEAQGNALQEAGGMTRSGKTFLTRTQFADRARSIGHAETASKFFTFTNEDVERMIAEDAKMRIETGVKKKLEEAKRFGFERKPKSQSAEPKNEPPATTAPTTTPKATPSRAKGAGIIEPPAATVTGVDVVGILGLKKSSS